MLKVKNNVIVVVIYCNVYYYKLRLNPPKTIDYHHYFIKNTLLKYAIDIVNSKKSDYNLTIPLHLDC